MHVTGLFLTLLAVALIVLKLLGVVTASWWIVLLPVYGPTLLSLATLLLIWLIGALAFGWVALRTRGGR